MAIVIEGDFEWDDVKAASNLDKHAVSFPEAATVFADPCAVYLDDGSNTDRVVVIGSSIRDKFFASFTLNGVNAIGLSAPGARQTPNVTSMPLEVRHD